MMKITGTKNSEKRLNRAFFPGTGGPLRAEKNSEPQRTSERKAQFSAKHSLTQSGLQRKVTDVDTVNRNVDSANIVVENLILALDQY
jgi:hypothetical protein